MGLHQILAELIGRGKKPPEISDFSQKLQPRHVFVRKLLEGQCVSLLPLPKVCF